MKIVYLLLLLIIIVITALVLQKINSSFQEGFEDNLPMALPILETCPHRMKSYIDGIKSITYCCEGIVNGNECQGITPCTMTSGADTNTPTCSQYLLDYNTRMAKVCPSTMPYYYEDNSNPNTISGCAAQITPDFSAPIGPPTTFCRIYNTSDDMNMVDSCDNKKMELDILQSELCKQVSCTVSMNKNKKGPPRHIVSYADPGASVESANGGFNTCQWKPSAKRYFESMNPKNEDILRRIDAGTVPWICGYVAPPPPCNPNKAVKTVVLYTDKPTWSKYIYINQIVIHDQTGKNIAPSVSITPIFKKGTENQHHNPHQPIINGKETERGWQGYQEDQPHLILTLPDAQCIKDIVYYGYKSKTDQNSGMYIELKDSTGNSLYKVTTTQDPVQKFIIPPTIFA